MLVALAAGYAVHPSEALTADQRVERTAEVWTFRQQLKITTARLEELEAQGHPFVPRGGLGPASR